MKPKWLKIEDKLILGPTGHSSACGLDIKGPKIEPQFLALWHQKWTVTFQLHI